MTNTLSLKELLLSTVLTLRAIFSALDLNTAGYDSWRMTWQHHSENIFAYVLKRPFTIMDYFPAKWSVALYMYSNWQKWMFLCLNTKYWVWKTIPENLKWMQNYTGHNVERKLTTAMQLIFYTLCIARADTIDQTFWQ